MAHVCLLLPPSKGIDANRLAPNLYQRPSFGHHPAQHEYRKHSNLWHMRLIKGRQAHLQIYLQAVHSAK